MPEDPARDERRFVAGPFDGNLSARETLLLKDREDRVRAPRTL